MSADDFELPDPPSDSRQQELWLQHAAGFLLFQEARQHAIDEISEKATKRERKLIEKGIDDTLYGLMMLIDGVTGRLESEDYRVELEHAVKLLKKSGADYRVVRRVDLFEGDGMCMGYHSWKEDDFGNFQPVPRGK